MNKNILVGIIVILLVVSAGEGYLVYKERYEKMAVAARNTTPRAILMNRQLPSGNRKPPMVILKGQKFASNPLSSKAYEIFPAIGGLSADAQKALTGWDVKTTYNADGSTQVDLIPKEAEDIKQSFTVKQGYKLYFIELNLADDRTGVDENRADDIGVLVDQNGIVQ